MGDIWSFWNVGLQNSTVNFDMLRIGGWNGSKYAFGYNSAGQETDVHRRYRCHGVYLKNSTLNLDDDYNWLHNQYSKIYVDNSSTLNSSKPIHLYGSNSDMICLAKGAKANINSKNYDASANKMVYGWNTENTYVGGSPNSFTSMITQEWYSRYKKCDSNGKNCYWPDTPYCDAPTTTTGTSLYFSDHNTTWYPNKASSYLCTSCWICSYSGMGYD
jgi:hypothetical protein